MVILALALLTLLWVRTVGRLALLALVIVVLTGLGGGNVWHGLGVLITLILLGLAWRSGRRTRRAEQAAAAQQDFIRAQAQANAEAMYRMWEQQQYARELAAIRATQEFPRLVGGAR